MNDTRDTIRFVWLFVFLFLLFFTGFYFVKENKIDKMPAAIKKAVNTNENKNNNGNGNHKPNGISGNGNNASALKAQGERTAPPQEVKNNADNSRKIPSGRDTSQRDVSLKGKPKIAIIIDDFGYNYKIAEEFLILEAPVTFSILPKLPYSSRIAQDAHAAGKKVILHLPMEPYSDRKLEPGTIMTDMTKDEIIKTFKQDADSVPFITGVNNHEGSKATENLYVMYAVLQECASRGLFYLDSSTSYSSAAGEAGRKFNMNINRRDIFLDNEDNVESILGILNKLMRIAEKNGFAIGIGHPRVNTAAAIKKFYEENKDKVDFIYVENLYK